MYDKILVPLDGSKLTEVVMPCVEQLVGRLGADLRILHVIEPDESSDGAIQRVYLDKVAAETRDGTGKYAEGSAAKTARVEIVVLSGDPAETIVNYAAKEEIGLIVMATHGRSGVKRWALGSVADKVIRSTRQPVLLIRANCPVPNWLKEGKLLVCLDGSKESEAIIPYADRFATLTGADVTLLTVLDMTLYQVVPGGYAHGIQKRSHAGKLEEKIENEKANSREYLDNIAAPLRQKGVSVKTDVRFGNIAEEIIAYANEIQAHTVAMSTHGRAGIARWTLGSIADKVLHWGQTPLLLVRPPKEK